MGQPFNAISIADIALMNRRAIEKFGGLCGEDNFLNRGSLEYILEATLVPVFGVDRFPTVLEKIAAIAHAIIISHVFRDGNKRTGLAVIEALSVMNDMTFSPTQEDEDFIVRIAAENLSIGDVLAWLKGRVRFKSRMP